MPTPRIAAAILLSACLLPACPALAQVQPAPAPPPQPTDAKEFLNDVASAYRARDVSERLTIRVSTNDADGERTSVVLHAAPADDKKNLSRRLHLDLGRLDVYLNGRDALVTNRADESTYFAATIDDPPTLAALFRAVRPVPLPQIAWLMGEGVERPLGTMLGDVAWGAPSFAENDAIEITGQSRSGPVKIVVDRAAKRLRSFTADLARGMRVEVHAVAGTAKPLASWRPSLDGRERVATLRELQSATPRSAVVGRRLPSIAFVTGGLEPWLPPTPTDEAPVAFVFFRADASGETPQPTRECVRVVVTALAEAMPGAKDARGRLVLVGVLGRGTTDPQRLGDATIRWGEDFGAADRRPVWTTADWTLIAGTMVDAAVVVHIAGGERRLHASLSLDPTEDHAKFAERAKAAFAPRAESPKDHKHAPEDDATGPLDFPAERPPK